MSLTGAVIESFPLEAALWLIDLDRYNCPLVDNIIISTASHCHWFRRSLLCRRLPEFRSFTARKVWKMVQKLCSEGCSRAKGSNLSSHAWETPLILFKSTSYKCVTLQKTGKSKRFWLQIAEGDFFSWPLREDTEINLMTFVSREWV